MKLLSSVSLIVVSSLLAAVALAQPAAPADAVRQRWDEIKYVTPATEQAKAFEELAAQAGDAIRAHPDDAELLIWRGIVLASEAGAKGGLGALSLAKQAREDFDKAIALDGEAMHGSAYTSLGSLYYQVPGWPIGFGDDEKAAQLLLKGLEKNPDGIDSNFFYGDYLRDQGRYADARKVLQKALAAAPREGRERADAGRRAEVEKSLAEVDRHLN